MYKENEKIEHCVHLWVKQVESVFLGFINKKEVYKMQYFALCSRCGELKK